MSTSGWVWQVRQLKKSGALFGMFACPFSKEGHEHVYGVGGLDMSGRLFLSPAAGLNGAREFSRLDMGPTRHGLRGVGGTGQDDLIIVGEYGTILHSTDGQTFEEKTIGSSGCLYEIWTSQKGHVYLVGDAGTVLASRRSRNRWVRLATHADSRIQFIRPWPSRGPESFLVGGFGGLLLACHDGKTMKRLDSGVESPLTDVVTFGDTLIITGDYGVMLRSEDAGKTFYQVGLEGLVADQDIEAIVSCDNEEVIAVGDGVTLRSTDRGITWEPEDIGTKNHLWALIVAHNGTIFAAGAGGTIVMGRHWTRVIQTFTPQQKVRWDSLLTQGMPEKQVVQTILTEAAAKPVG